MKIENLNLLFVFALIVLAGIICLIVYYLYRGGFVRHPYRRHGWTKVLVPGAYDPLKFKTFDDALTALCLALETRQPQLLAVDLALPIAYGTNVSRLGPQQYLKMFSPTRKDFTYPAVMITLGLLDAGFTNQEIEAIVADVLAKLSISPEKILEWSDVARIARQVGLDENFLESVREEFAGNPAVGQVLLEDTWAAWLTKDAHALQTAIEKSFDALQNQPVERDLACMTAFADPPHLVDKHPRGYQRTQLNRRHDLAVARVRVKELRLVNLKLIDAGTRQPHMEVRAARPVTAPRGWK